MSEILNFDYTLKDIQNIGEIINKQSKELDMNYQEYLNYILGNEDDKMLDVATDMVLRSKIDEESNYKPNIRDIGENDKVPEYLEDIFDIVYDIIYSSNKGLDYIVPKEMTYLRYRLEDNIRLTAFVTAVNLLFKMVVIDEEDLDKCMKPLLCVNDEIEIVSKDPSWLLKLKKFIFGDKAEARIKFDIKHDSAIFRTFVYFVFDKDLGSIIENSLIHDKSKVIRIK